MIVLASCEVFSEELAVSDESIVVYELELISGYSITVSSRESAGTSGVPT